MKKLLLGSVTASVGAFPAYGQNLTQSVQLRGTIDASSRGLLPDVVDDQSKILQAAIRHTAQENKILFLPAGHYYVSNIDLPNNTRLMGVSGATRIIYTGRGHALIGENANRIEISNIDIDGANHLLGDYTSGLIQLRNVKRLTMDRVNISGSSKYGIALENSGGIIEDCEVTGAFDAAIYAVQSTGLTIRNNHIHDCANGGILVHRWQIGEDNSMITGNRIERIAAKNGGTGPYGNGINLFRAGNVMITNNHISDCAFSAIRANSASNVQIISNSCYRSGETAIYAEFEFQGAVVSNNIVDGGTLGISIANFDKGGRLSVVSGNLIRNITAKGPYPEVGPGFGQGLAIEADANVTGNTIEKVAKWGMLVGWGPYLRNVVIANNIVRQVPIGIALSVVDGIGSVGIHNNIFDQTPKGAIIGHHWHEAVTKDLAIRSGSAFKTLSISGNQIG